MNLDLLDWGIIIAFFVLSLIIGLVVIKRSGSSASEYFLSGRNMPWWLLGISMVATTFSSDTPNLVTDIVRRNGVAGNWEWWAFLLTGMLTVFVYAKLWRRSKVFTDIEFYELRYSGKAAAFLRGFRAIYLGFFFNIMIMATVSLAAIKIGGVMLGLNPIQTLSIAVVITVIYSSLGGLLGVLLTDFFQFIIAMIGAIWGAVYIVNMPQVGGLGKLLAHPDVVPKLNMIPDFSNSELLVGVFIIPIAVQWWSVWYPGAEPGGGGYIVQRILSAKNERHAIGATLLFNIMHYALRSWPWILVALASLIVFPNVVDVNADPASLAGRGLQSLKEAYPNMPNDKIGHDLAYSAMLTYLPHGLLGIVIASLIAAYMSTIATHLNWGSSYIVNDYYKRFLKPEASDKEMVNVGRMLTFFLMTFSAILALYLQSALDAFKILLQIGAGTGLLFILRWFWWRINAWSEITAMAVSFILALYFEVIHPNVLGFDPISSTTKLLLGVGITTLAWIVVTLFTKPADNDTLHRFYKLIRPAGRGWEPIKAQLLGKGELTGREAKAGELSLEILCMVISCLAIYATLFATGFWIYGNQTPAIILTVVAVACAWILLRIWGRMRIE